MNVKKKKCGLFDKDLSSLNHLPLLLSEKIMSHFLTLSSKKKQNWLTFKIKQNGSSSQMRGKYNRKKYLKWRWMHEINEVVLFGMPFIANINLVILSSFSLINEKWEIWCKGHSLT